MTHAPAIQHSRNLDVLRDVRARFEALRGQVVMADAELGEEYAEALEQLDEAITTEVMALNAIEAAAE